MEKPPLNRRTFLSTLGAAAAAPLVARDYGPGALPVRYPEPDVKVLEPAVREAAAGIPGEQALRPKPVPRWPPVDVHHWAAPWPSEARECRIPGIPDRHHLLQLSFC